MAWNLNFDGSTKLKDWWAIVKENFNILKTKQDEHTEAIEALVTKDTWTPTFYWSGSVNNNLTITEAKYTLIGDMCFFRVEAVPTTFESSGTKVSDLSLPFAEDPDSVRWYCSAAVEVYESQNRKSGYVSIRDGKISFAPVTLANPGAPIAVIGSYRVAE